MGSRQKDSLLHENAAIATDPLSRKQRDGAKAFLSLRDITALSNGSLNITGSLDTIYFVQGPTGRTRGSNLKRADTGSDSNVTGSDDDACDDRKSREGREAWLLLMRAFVYNALAGLTWSTFSLYYVEYTQYFQASKALVGWIVAIQTTLAYFLSIFVSWPLDRFGCDRCAALGGLVFALGMCFSCLAPSVAVLFITQGVVTGSGLSIIFMVGAVVIQQHFNKNRTLACGLGIMGFSFGQFFGPVVISYFISEFGWRGAILLHGGISLNIAPLGMTLKSPKGHKSTTKGTNIRDMLADAMDFRLMRKPTFCLFFLGGFFSRYHNTALLQHIPSRAVHLGITPGRAAYLVSVIYLANTATRIVVSVGANIFHRVDRAALMTSGHLVESVSDVIMLCVPGYVGCMAGAATFGAGMGISYTIATVVIVDLVGVDSLPRGLSLYNFSQSFALLIGAPFTGFLYDVTREYDVPFYVSLSTGIVAISLMLAIVGLRYKHRRQDEQAQTG